MMFKKVIHTPGFWKSVVILGITFIILFLIFKWAIEGFTFDFLSEQNPYVFFPGTLLAGFLYGFFVTYGKFLSRIKKEESKK